MDAQIGRLTLVLTVGFAGTGLTSSPIDTRGWAGGEIHLPSTYAGGTIGFLGATGAGATYRPRKDNAGAAIAIPAGATRVIQLPDAVMVGAFSKVTRAATAPAVVLGVVLKG